MKRVFASASWCISIVCFWCASANIQAQSYGELHGTWINARFMELLKKTASVASAMEAVTPRYPLWIMIDSTMGEGQVKAAFETEGFATLILLKAQLLGSELRWGLGDEVAPQWLVTVDQRQQTFLALHDLDSVEGTPHVMGKLPSRNQDPKFIIDRMINASVLAGKYRDRNGKLVEFSTYMDAFWDDVRYSVTVDVKKESHQLTVVLTAVDGKATSYIVTRRVKDLILTSPDGTVQTLTFDVKL